jgi:hypothetical protein
MLMKRIIRLTESELIKVVRRVITEQESTVNIRINGAVQEECDTCDGDQISYVILNTLRTISDTTQITSEDKTYAEYEIQNYTDVNKVKSVLEPKLKEITGKQITCVVNGNNLTCNI